MSDYITRQRCKPYGRVCGSFILILSLFRGVRLLLFARPKTPLRVLCAVTFDTMHRLRTSKRLPYSSQITLLALLDLGALMNARLDQKRFDERDYDVLQDKLTAAGLAELADDYLARLHAIEQCRPQPDGNNQRHREVVSYRESVIRISLAAVVSISFDCDRIDEGLDAILGDDDLQLVFKIVMLIQVIDDVLDYKKDAAAGLPSFLTASASLSNAFDLTRQAIQRYRDIGELSLSDSVLPFRIALCAGTVGTRWLLTCFRWRYGAAGK